jgi:hypothetical protein
MADIINLQNYIIGSKQESSFTPWKKRFGEDLDFFSRFSDLSDKLLYLLAKSDYESAEALRELVMAVLDKGPVTKYLFLPDQEQWAINTIAVFLQEQVYFEIMGRLGWIAEYACQRYSLVALVESYGKQNEVCGRAMPVLSQSDPEFPEYIKFAPELQKKYLESRFRNAYESFGKKLKETGVIP